MENISNNSDQPDDRNYLQENGASDPAYDVPSANENPLLPGERTVSDLYPPVDWIEPFTAGMADWSRLTAEGAEFTMQQRLYAESTDVTARMTQHIAGMQPGSNDMLLPPEPLDTSTPLDVAAFKSENPIAACEVLKGRLKHACQQNVHLIERTTFNEGEDLLGKWGYAIRLHYESDQGMAGMMIVNGNEFNIQFAGHDGRGSEVKYKLAVMPDGAEVMVKRTGSLSLDGASSPAKEMFGSAPNSQVGLTVMAERQSSDQFAEQIAEMTGEKTWRVVGLQEAMFLNSLIGSAEPLGELHDRGGRGSLQEIINRRIQGDAASAPLNAAWAARELERIADEYPGQPDGAPRVWEYEDHSVTIEVQPAGAEPASLRVTTARAVPAAFIAKWQRRPTLSQEDHTITIQDTLIAAGNKVTLDRMLTVCAGTDDRIDTGDPVRNLAFSYDTADMTEVNRFLNLLYKPL